MPLMCISVFFLVQVKPEKNPDLSSKCVFEHPTITRVEVLRVQDTPGFRELDQVGFYGST